MRKLKLEIEVPYENLDRVYKSKFFKYDKKYVEQSKQEFGFRYIPKIKVWQGDLVEFALKPIRENEIEYSKIVVRPFIEQEGTALIVDPFEKTGLRVGSLEDARRNKKKPYKILIRTMVEALKKTDFKLSDIIKNTDKVGKLEENGSRVFWCVWDEVYQNYACHKFERGEDGELHEVDVFQQAIGNILDEIEFEIVDPWNAKLEEGNEAGYYKFKECAT